MKKDILNKTKNMKRKFVTSMLSFIILLFSSSCSEYLDVVPDNIAVIEDAFKTRESANRFLATLYGYLPNYTDPNRNPALCSGDEIYVNTNVSRTWPSRQLALGGQNKTSPLLGYWGSGSVSNLFVALRDCNIFLENLDKPFDLTESEKIRWRGEAKFLKAYFHFYLMQMYGPIPIVRENIPAGAGIEEVKVKRDPVDEVVDYIVEVLDEAIADLPSEIANELDDLGRITKPIAAAIKARVLVTAASPLFNGNTDYANFVDKDGTALINTTYSEEKWARAATACQEAISIAESAGHALYIFDDSEPGWSDLTNLKLTIRGSVTDRWNDEIIWGASGRTTAALQNWSQAKIANGLTAENRESTASFWAPTFRIAEMFYSENGVPISEDMNYDYANRYNLKTASEDDVYNIHPGSETVKLHFNREPRFYASVGFDTGTWMGHGEDDDTKQLYVRAKSGEDAGRIDAQRWSNSGYWPKKLVYFENIQRTGGGSGYSLTNYPFPVVRLADVYLMYAEALNESGNIAEAQVWIDKIRERAGLDGVVSSWANASTNPSKPTTKDGLREIIHHERMIELVFEGRRFWDLRRWKKATDFLNSDIKGWNTMGETPGTFYNIFISGEYKFQTRDYLWPIAEIDIISNDNLVQNPGW